MLVLELDEPLDDDPTRVIDPGGGGGGGGGGGAGAPWQALVPESVNVLPATGTNFQS